MTERSITRRDMEAGRAQATTTAGSARARAPAKRGRLTATSSPEPAGCDGADRLQRIATAAYYRAERRGFVGGSAEQDWLDAESEVDGAPKGGA